MFTAAGVRVAAGAGGLTELIDELVEAGFGRDRLEASQDLTTIGLAPESVIVAIPTNGRCLVGQLFLIERVFESQSVPPTSTGRCLIGAPGS